MNFLKEEERIRSEKIAKLKETINTMNENHKKEIQKKLNMLSMIRTNMESLSKFFSEQLSKIQKNLSSQINEISKNWEINISEHLKRYEEGIKDSILIKITKLFIITIFIFIFQIFTNVIEN